MLVPVKAYLTCGVGAHPHELVAFELALRDAGIAAQNLVVVSSIFPPGCGLIERSEGERSLIPGQILHVVLSRNATCEPRRTLGASIGLARPSDPTEHGFVAEHQAFDQNETVMIETAEALASTMLASSLGVDLDPALPPDVQARRLKESGRVAESCGISAITESKTDGGWTCAVAACVFLMRWMLSPH